MVTGQHWRRSPRTQLFQNEVQSLRSHKLQPPGEASTDIYSIRFWMVDPSKPTSPWRIRSSVLFRKRTFLSPNWSHVLICSGIPGNTACRNPKSQVQKKNFKRFKYVNLTILTLNYGKCVSNSQWNKLKRFSSNCTNISYVCARYIIFPTTTMEETCGPGTCTAGHGFRAATPRPANPKVPALGITGVEIEPTEDFQPKFLWTFLNTSSNNSWWVRLKLLWPRARVHAADLP